MRDMPDCLKLRLKLFLDSELAGCHVEGGLHHSSWAGQRAHHQG